MKRRGMVRSWILAAAVLFCAVACRGDGDAAQGVSDRGMATAYARGTDHLSAEELEAGRMDMDWRRWVRRDTAAGGADTTGAANRGSAARGQKVPESWEDISARSVNSGPVALPIAGDVTGPGVVRVQILLARALFSPGVIDGRWGSNTEKGVYWLQEREGLAATGEVDEATWERLQRLAHAPRELVRQHQLTEDEVAGPFVELPEEYYDRRDMDCQCYESLAEKLAERFHVAKELLAQLNPGVDLDTLQAGAVLHVPSVDYRAVVAGAQPAVDRLVVSDGGRYVHALDREGRIVYHFPATLGSAYSPSPTGDYRITAIAHDPTWHYQPALLEGVADDEPDAVLPPGPNNAVGVVWLQLSVPHYGIHGTSAPETIGYATSNGCVRLTNWDADFLSRRVREGTPVEFRDVTS
jgi:lipoprotein-anchoring transpeptidase ErfK/SrfK